MLNDSSLEISLRRKTIFGNLIQEIYSLDSDRSLIPNRLSSLKRTKA